MIRIPEKRLHKVADLGLTRTWASIFFAENILLLHELIPLFVRTMKFHKIFPIKIWNIIQLKAIFVDTECYTDYPNKVRD